MSYWERLHLENRSGITIVGGGFSGLNLALAIKTRDPSKPVRILEAGGSSLGASRKNAGFLCFGSPSELLEDMNSAGRGKVLGTAEERWEGISKIRARFSSERIGLEEYGGYELFLGPSDHHPVEEDLPQLNKDLSGLLGFSPYRPLSSEEINRMGFEGISGGYRIEGEAIVDPYLYHSALCEEAREQGIDLQFGVPVRDHLEKKGRVELWIEDNEEALFCEKTVFATNGYTEGLVPNSGIAPARGQVLITEPLDELPFRGSFHMDGGNYYFRNVGDRVLLGGGRGSDPVGERTMKEGGSPRIRGELEKLLQQRILPGRSFQIEDGWSGIMGFTEDKYPRMEKIGERSYLMGGLSGMGVALSSVISGRMAEWILEEG